MDSVIDEKTAHAEYETSDLERTTTDYAPNYNGLTVKTVLVYLAANLIIFAQLLNLVGSGAYGRYIADVVGGSSEVLWLSSVLVILTCVLGPPLSQIGDYWGRKWLIVGSTCLSTVGCIIVSRATSMGMAIAGEVLVGAGFGIQPLLYAVASEILPRRYRPAAQAGINFFTGVGGLVGLLVGSTFVKNTPTGFRTYWYMTAGILGLCALLFAACYSPPPRDVQKALTSSQRIRRLDWVGYSLLMSGLVLFTMALSWSQNPFQWTNAHILAPFLISVALLSALGYYEWKVKPDGLFHHDLFSRDRNFAIAILLIFLEGMIFFALNNFLPFETSVLWETDPFTIGLRVSMAFISGNVSSILLAFYGSARKSIRLPIAVGFLLFMVFNILMAVAGLGSSAAVFGYPAVLGFGFGMCLASIIAAAQLSAPQHLIAIASGLLISTRSLGGTVGLAIYNAIFYSGLNKKLVHNIAGAVVPLGLSPKALPAFIAALVANDKAALIAVPGITPKIIGAGVLALQKAYLYAFRWIWVTAACLSFLGLIASCFLADPKKDMTMHVDAPLEDE